jgi:hypothetical protein
VAYTFRSGADTAWITDELGSAEAAEPLVLRLARLQQLAAVMAIGAGVVLARLTSLSTSVVVTGVVLVVTGLVMAIVMPERGWQRPRHGAAGGRGGVVEAVAASSRSMATMLSSGARAVWRSGPLRLLVAVLALSGLASEAIDRLDIRRLDDLGLADYDEVLIVGVIAVSEALVGAAALWVAQRRFEPGRSARAMAVLLAASAFGIAALGLVAVLPVAAVGLVVQGGLRQAAAPFATAWANAFAPSKVRATVHSFVEQANSVGEIGGGVVLGLVAAATTVPTAMTVSLVLMMAAAAVAFRGTPTVRSG